jgi:hypothetical protein
MTTIDHTVTDALISRWRLTPVVCFKMRRQGDRRVGVEAENGSALLDQWCGATDR